MKLFISLLIVIGLYFSAHAQFSISDTKESKVEKEIKLEIQDARKKAKRIANCIAKIDDRGLEQLQHKAQTYQYKAMQLCKEGRVKDAQSQVRNMGTAMKNDNYIKRFDKCLSSELPGLRDNVGLSINQSAENICDNLKKKEK